VIYINKENTWETVMIEELVVIGIIVFIGSVIQGTVGFGFGLFAVPALTWTGTSLSGAVAILLVSTLSQAVFATYYLREHIVWKEVIPAATIRFITIPIGVALLILLDTMDKSQMRQIIGIVVLILLVLQITLKITPKQNIHKTWTFTAFSLSGVLQGLVGMGGPLMIFWVMAKDWNSNQSRSFLLVLSLLASPLQLVILYFFSSSILTSMLTGLILIPIVILATKIGIKIGSNLDKRVFKGLTQGILGLMATVSILTPILS